MHHGTQKTLIFLIAFDILFMIVGLTLLIYYSIRFADDECRDGVRIQRDSGWECKRNAWKATLACYSILLFMSYMRAIFFVTGLHFNIHFFDLETTLAISIGFSALNTIAMGCEAGMGYGRQHMSFPIIAGAWNGIFMIVSLILMLQEFSRHRGHENSHHRRYISVSK